MSARIRLSRGLGAALIVFALALGLSFAPGAALAGAKIEITDDSYITLGMGLRTSYTNGEAGAPNGEDYAHNFELESWRLYVSGQIMPYVLFEFNADYEGTGNASAQTTDLDQNEIQVLDGIIKLEFNDYVNLWAGRFLPPSDRANLSGPYYLNAYDFPFVQQYPNIFAGRDEGAAYWGQIGGGMFKWQFGAFEGLDDTNAQDTMGETVGDEDDLLYAGRLVLNLWDPEPGYYNASTYYGEKDVLAIGLVGQIQNNAVVGNCDTLIDPADFPTELDFIEAILAADGLTVCNAADDVGDFRAWNVDVLMEKKLDIGVVSFNGAYYDYDRDRLGTPGNEGAGWFTLGSILLPQEFGPGKWRGKFEPFVRYQLFDPRASGESDHTRWDVGVNYVLRGHNARITAQYSLDRGDPSDNSSKDIYKIGLQFQL